MIRRKGWRIAAARSLAGALFLLFALHPCAAAQNETAAARACIDTLSASAFTRVPVYLEAKAVDSVSRAVLPSADSLAVRVAALIRLSLSDSTKSLPEGESLLRWREVGGAVRVAVHRDGPFTWSLPSYGPGADTSRDASRHLLEQALATVRAAGGRLGWPADATGDSLVFLLQYRWPRVSRDGKLQPVVVREAVPVFSMAMPWTTPAVLRYQRSVDYPIYQRAAAAEGPVVVRYLVDSTGRVALGTFEDARPEEFTKLDRAHAEHRRGFLDAVRASLSSARFEAARTGGCPVPEVIEQGFTFHLRR